MDTKLTLSLDRSVIKAAKTYAKSNQISLSKLIESYLATLTNKKSASEEITPLVASLSGVIQITDPVEPMDGYSDFLTEKYK